MKNTDQVIKIANMRSPCPIANTLDIIGDKWTLLVIRDLFSGKNTYSELQASPESIPTNILADRLKRLVNLGIIQKQPYQQRPIRYAYELTEQGHKLGTLLKEISKWGIANIAGTQARIKMDI